VIEIIGDRNKNNEAKAKQASLSDGHNRTK